jgi:hypothetical protein
MESQSFDMEVDKKETAGVGMGCRKTVEETGGGVCILFPLLGERKPVAGLQRNESVEVARRYGGKNWTDGRKPVKGLLLWVTRACVCLSVEAVTCVEEVKRRERGDFFSNPLRNALEEAGQDRNGVEHHVKYLWYTREPSTTRILPLVASKLLHHSLERAGTGKTTEPSRGCESRWRRSKKSLQSVQSSTKYP